MWILLWRVTQVVKQLPSRFYCHFIENAFKHGISNSAELNIVINLTIFVKHPAFYTENRLLLTPRITEHTGIANTNTKNAGPVIPG
ncbi:MAG: hypothetical protein ABIS01_05180 [Ferruginibacter sp.]